MTRAVLGGSDPEQASRLQIIHHVLDGCVERALVHGRHVLGAVSVRRHGEPRPWRLHQYVVLGTPPGLAIISIVKRFWLVRIGNGRYAESPSERTPLAAEEVVRSDDAHWIRSIVVFRVKHINDRLENCFASDPRGQSCLQFD